MFAPVCRGRGCVVEAEPRPDQLDSEILDAIAELSDSLLARGEQIARRLGVPSFCLKAMHLLSSPMAMRDLGRKMHCDPSFVTTIADVLEQRGLARREPGTADRRIKNLVLTPEGTQLRQQVLTELTAFVPWRGFDDDERACLLTLIRKMASANAPAAEPDARRSAAAPPAGKRPAGEVSTP